MEDTDSAVARALAFGELRRGGGADRVEYARTIDVDVASRLHPREHNECRAVAPDQLRRQSVDGDHRAGAQQIVDANRKVDCGEEPRLRTRHENAGVGQAVHPGHAVDVFESLAQAGESFQAVGREDVVRAVNGNNDHFVVAELFEERLVRNQREVVLDEPRFERVVDTESAREHPEQDRQHQCYRHHDDSSSHEKRDEFGQHGLLLFAAHRLSGVKCPNT